MHSVIYWSACTVLVYFILACGQTTVRLATTVLDQLKRLMRPVLIMSPRRPEWGAPRQAAWQRVQGDDTVLVGRQSHDSLLKRFKRTPPNKHSQTVYSSYLHKNDDYCIKNRDVEAIK